MSQLLHPLRHGDFRRLVGGRSLNHFANAMAPIVLSFAVLDLTGSVVDLGLVVGARSVANVVVLLFGGVLADRLPRRLILQGTSAAAAVVQAVIAAAVLLGFASIAVLVVLSVANGVVAAASLPAVAALIPQTVPPDEIRPANAVARVGVNLGLVTGASTAGLLVGFSGPGWGIAVNALLFAGSALCYLGITVGGTARPPEQRTHPLTDLLEGWAEFVSRTWVWVVVVQFLVVNAAVAGGLHVLGPTIADRTFGRTTWGLLLAAQTAGALLGALIAARTRVRHPLRLGVAVTAVEAVPLLALAGTSNPVPLVCAMVANGIALEQFAVAWDVSLQENVPADKLARVYSCDAMGSFIAIPLGEMAAGPISTRLGTAPTLVAGAALVVAATAATLLSKDVRGLRAGGS
ncbi:MFS transporter [Saccharothrix violaceirubra]|uniref:Putative MFS family arabinose efflux permease n=1 Tax=Saccharothrix violaceirubra TaxID=413306 RepID=A0A7W7WWL8_9PSEU|nr:MFS transporter [Saccharothrix violaceirubra]MBB4965733.1 putative MFS family arabinose efflux permease [Saccharothrix violaceirubra]